MIRKFLALFALPLIVLMLTTGCPEKEKKIDVKVEISGTPESLCFQDAAYGINKDTLWAKSETTVTFIRAPHAITEKKDTIWATARMKDTVETLRIKILKDAAVLAIDTVMNDTTKRLYVKSA